ncbi:FISUMP domain-containing protein [uncultured Fibrobacter sp.]|uniref:FISUMP domain-containing protein n=1 Tax=uncultured Fibrobacter sp. TaxID=261512 RepID=UPI0025E2C7EB|nr:FISUMP domain-containing protein [uncultured Fibrobacter sp.]
MAAFAMAFALAACDDDESSFVRPGDDSSSSVCEDCDESSSSVILSGDSHEGSCSSSEKSSSSRENDKSSSSEKIKSSSSNKVVSSSSEKQESSSSSSVKQSSSSIASSSSSVKSSSSSVKSSSSVVSSSSKDVASSSSIYVPFDHSKTLGYQKFEEDGYKTFTDPRNGRSYYYITIYSEYKGYSVTVMAENLNIGDMVLGENDQNDDTKIERYCYNNDTTKCDEFGGLYQWAEMMQLPSRCNTESCADLIQPNHQGICPDGWRLFTYDDYCVVRGYEDINNDGIKGLRSTYGFSGTNSSGFSLTGAGQRTKKGGFDRLKKTVYWFYPQEHEYDEKLYVRNGYISAVTDHAPSAGDGDEKVFGFSVRCTKLEE